LEIRNVPFFCPLFVPLFHGVILDYRVFFTNPRGAKDPDL
jgi:hypothetical protein